ncbi:MAG: hypothetical protein ACO1OC_13470, partial [Tuberibacillus sp.]
MGRNVRYMHIMQRYLAINQDCVPFERFQEEKMGRFFTLRPTMVDGRCQNGTQCSLYAHHAPVFDSES